MTQRCHAHAQQLVSHRTRAVQGRHVRLHELIVRLYAAQQLVPIQRRDERTHEQRHQLVHVALQQFVHLQL